MPYRPTERTRARAADARERIVVAALELLAEGGYAAASVHAVARRAGLATGSVYRHFPSKTDLLAEVFRRACRREIDTLARAGADLPPAERIAAWVEVFARRALAEPRRAYALLAEPVDPAVEAERLAFRRACADLFAAALREGDFAPCDVDLAAAAIVGALGEALLGPLSPADPHPLGHDRSPSPTDPHPLGHDRSSSPADPHPLRRDQPPDGADALVAGLQSFVLSAIQPRSHDRDHP